MPGAEAVDERGSFAYGSCGHCGWEGPARRSRGRARKDIEHHLADKPKHTGSAEVARVSEPAPGKGSNRARRKKRRDQ